jgi:hypothetical protein
MGKLPSVSPYAGVAFLYQVEVLMRSLKMPDPYPWAIEEGFDVYQTLVQTKGSVIGINSGQLDIMSGDSA